MRDKLKNRVIFLFLIVLVVISSLSGCIPVQVTGSGNVINRTFNFVDFNKVRISYGFTAEVKLSSTYSIEVAADDNLFDYIYVKKDDDDLPSIVYSLGCTK